MMVIMKIICNNIDDDDDDDDDSDFNIDFLTAGENSSQIHAPPLTGCLNGNDHDNDDDY